MAFKKPLILYLPFNTIGEGMCLFVDNEVIFDLSRFTVAIGNAKSVFDESVYKGRVFYGSKNWQEEVKLFSF